MKKSLFIALVSSQFLIHGSFASLGAELEGTLAVCGYGKSRTLDPFTDVSLESNKKTSTALVASWKKLPSSEIDFDVFIRDSKAYKYLSPLCEEALQRAIRKKLGASAADNILKKRCSALNQDPLYSREASGYGNSWVKANSSTDEQTSSENYWCDGDSDEGNEFVQIACAALKANRDLRDTKSDAYRTALRSLKKDCSTGSRASRDIASREAPDPDDEDSDEHEEDRVYRGRPVPRALPGDMNVPVIQRIVSVPPYIPPRPGCAQGAARALVINPPGGALYTVANAAVAGLGAFLSYKGARHADDLRYRVAQSTIDAYKAVGAVPDLYAGRMFWGQGGVYPFGGGPIRGGVCGAPPFNTAFTGCMGGMPGQMPVGPGGIYGNGFFPGGGCGGIGGGPGGMPGGIPGGMGMGGGMMPGAPCGTPWGMGPNPYGANPYMNNAAMMGRPGGFMGPVNPMMLDQERQRLQDLQNQIARQRNQMNQFSNLNNQLMSLDQNRNQLLNRLQGYNGLLSNLNGPGGFNGNPGVYNPYGGALRPGMGGLPPGGFPGGGFPGGIPGGGMGGFPGGGMPGGGLGGGILGGGCPTISCYPGNPGAYYAPPMIYGNSGFGGAGFGFPNRNNISFGINYTNNGF